LDKYAQTFWTSALKIPVFIGEFHAPHVHVQKDMEDIMDSVLGKEYPFFLGVSFFEFGVSYYKQHAYNADFELRFGMFGYGDCELSVMDYWGKSYNIRNLVPRKDKFGQTIHEAVRAAFGGQSELKLKAAPCTTLHVS